MNSTKVRRNRSLKRVLIFISLAIVILTVVLIAFISPITKYLIEKNDTKYTGREITMDWVYTNPLTGYIYLSGIKIYERNSKKVFISSNGIGINVSLRKLLSKTYEISSLILDDPKFLIIQKHKLFNFSDIIEKFSPSDSTHHDPAHVNILNVEIKNGQLQFIDVITPINYAIKKVNIKSTGKAWNVDTITGSIEFIPVKGSGSVKNNFMINTNNFNYKMSTVIKELDLDLAAQYMKDLTNYGTFTAKLDAKLQVSGNLKDKQAINLKGNYILSDYHFGKDSTEDYLSFKKLSISIKEVAPKEHKYLIDSVILVHPFFKFERYDHLDNIQNMFGESGSNVAAAKANRAKFNLIIEIARYMRLIFSNFLESDYKINAIKIIDGDFYFHDYSINEKFAVQLDHFNLSGDSIYSSKKWVELKVESSIKPAGHISIDASMNPKNNDDFNINYKIEKIPAPVFNPYLISYTSFPLDRGIVEVNGNWVVRNDVITSTNHFIAVDARVSKKIRNKDNKWIPMPLIMSFIRERGNVIDYEIPISGDLKNPKFHLGDVIFDILENIFVKPPTTPYRMEIKNIETTIEKSIDFKWGMHQAIPDKSQDKFMTNIAEYLKKNPEAELIVQPLIYKEKEKEYVLLYEARKKYVLLQTKDADGLLTTADSLKIEKTGVKDSAFVKYLNSHLKDSMLFTIQDKCLAFVGEKLVNKKYEQLVKNRESAFMDYFIKNKTEKQIKLLAAKNTRPLNGFSSYKISYKGDVPESLIKAYEDLRDLNNKAPRKKYYDYRK